MNEKLNLEAGTRQMKEKQRKYFLKVLMGKQPEGI